MSDFTPQDFVQKWANTPLNERQIAQLHFMDLCRLVGHPEPSANGLTEDGRHFVFEQSLKKDTGQQGYADVWYEGHFAIEYKGAGKDLDAAYRQLLQYHEHLKSPPILIVTDLQIWHIYTKFNNADNWHKVFSHEDLAKPDSELLRLLREAFFHPERLNPNRTTDEVTQETADIFLEVMRALEEQGRIKPDLALSPERRAIFMTRLVFSLFAEDVDLLPLISERGIFTYIVEKSRQDAGNFVEYITQLFEAMEVGSKFMMEAIPHFNGALFQNIDPEHLPPTAIERLYQACKVNWRNINPTIFGTLFERAIDVRKRSQLGAHYTSREDILLIVEPVLMYPLRREWVNLRQTAEEHRQKYEGANNKRDQNLARDQLLGLRDQLLNRLRTIRVLDPACGSGNFLYVALQELLNLEKEIIHDPLWAEFGREIPQVHPRQFYGMEVDEIAHALASIVVWIGYIQWMDRNGYGYHREPILEDLSQHIVRKDAILAFDEVGNPVEPQWQPVDVIMGNPPFLGEKKLRRELGDEYIQHLRDVYKDRLSGNADLVTYWFERARAELAEARVHRVGLLATNSIRQPTNRVVLERIKQTGDIFYAWSDRPWMLEGAAVNISMVGFDGGVQTEFILDGAPVSQINADLQNTIDATKAQILPENIDLCFMGVTPAGKFDIEAKLAQQMLRAVNVSGKDNADVVKPYFNGDDLTARPRNRWTIDFGVSMAEAEAQEYQMPFDYLESQMKPERMQSRQPKREKNLWWRYTRPRPQMRLKLQTLARYIATPQISKHRIFVWLSPDIVPANLLLVFSREDDYFFGVLHSKIHVSWAFRLKSTLEDRPRYIVSACFETFPFPWLPFQEPTSDPQYLAIAAAAKQLHEERDAWLNPPNAPDTVLKDRTLTHLYNALNVYRGKETIRVKLAAANFAPRLDELHRALDVAVCAAYGWDEALLEDEEGMLRALLALNLQRAKHS